MIDIEINNDELISEGVVGLAMTVDMFSEEIETRVRSGQCEGYIEATAEYIEELDCDATEIKHLISPTLIGKIEAEAYNRGMMKNKRNTTNLLSLFA